MRSIKEHKKRLLSSQLLPKNFPSLLFFYSSHSSLQAVLIPLPLSKKFFSIFYLVFFKKSLIRGIGYELNEEIF
ncbi:unnamed protein product [Meloidogyne enterolobii]|uniref:Uncharacterized protein n=1 Tax=Meloidogyne enterolobii TaxID=390850 RepID=A0ACB0ZMJ8_MELEN